MQAARQAVGAVGGGGGASAPHAHASVNAASGGGTVRCCFRGISAVRGGAYAQDNRGVVQVLRAVVGVRGTRN